MGSSCCLDNNGGPATKPSRLQRNKLWQISRDYHCSIIGTCLTLNELRKICRKANIIFGSPPRDYDIHRAFIQVASEPTLATRLLNKSLERKFQSSIKRFAKALHAEDLAQLWKQATANGDIIGPYWAVMSHPATTTELADLCCEDVHMLSHLSGTTRQTELRHHATLKQRKTELEKDLATTRARLHEQRELNQIFVKRHALFEDTKRQLEQAQSKIKALTAGTQLIDLQQQVNSLQAQLRKLTHDKERIQTKMHNTQCRLQQTLQQNSVLRQQMKLQPHYSHESNQLVNALFEASCDQHCEHKQTNVCPSINLCGQKILYVGGRNRLTAHFRNLVEQNNGCFLHHDGGRHDAPGRLNGTLQQADAVMCPIDCISHDACLRIKRFCKQHSKPLVMLRSASLASFTKGLYEVSN